ncbi:hypothetical protein [Rheinheimera sp.]|uniref:hypothetical protein n=1 Tax=Rheinheimera sp. TaxID=1869214 RepID=UPI0023551844|nr:hypothetical protein [Rheinheimera sp.]
MLQSLWGSKLPLRLLKSIYRRLLALLLHCVKHPIKTFFFIVKAYLLLMLFALCLAFSVGSFAQEQTLQCLDGGTLIDYDGQMVCYVPAEISESCPLVGAQNWPDSANTNGSKHVSPIPQNYSNSQCPPSSGNIVYSGCTVTINYDYQLPENCSLTPFSVTMTYYSSTTTTNMSDNQPTPVTSVNSYTNTQTNVVAMWGPRQESPTCPPESAPLLSSMGELPDGTKICFKPAETPPCDCSDLTGSNPQGINYFYAANGTYSQANPPNCISRDDNENGDIPSCNCKLIATKWSSADVNINGTIYQRWQPIPDQNGVTGVFTGGQCDESEKDTPPDTPEKCYQLGNGQNFCLEDPDQKCAKIDGIMTCESGCGTVNGEFFCFENDDLEEPLPDPDDNITDPDTPLNNMVKRDFKDVLGGTESRLDILSRLMSDIKTNTSKGDSDLAAKQDATNRLLKEISDKLDEESDDETPTNPQPTYNTDKLEEFVNPNDWGEKNFRTVAVAFKDRIMQTPIMQTVQNFFNVALSGTCPTWQTTVNMPFGGTFDININQLCSEAMTNIWPSIRAIIVLIFTFLAFKVAFTNE